MDSNNLIKNESNETGLKVDQESLNYLKGASRWAYFLAILGFVFVALMFIGGIVAGIMFTVVDSIGEGLPFPGFLIGLIYLVFGIVYFFPVLYLFKFANGVNKVILSKNNTDLITTFKNLKAHYRYIGIMTIVTFVLYIVFMIVLVAGGLMAGMMDSYA